MMDAMVQVAPHTHHFLFANFLPEDIPGILDLADVLYSNYPDQFVWAGPDILPGASSLCDWNRIYGLMRSRQDTGMRFGQSNQFDSYEQDYPPTQGPAAGSYPLPPEATGPYWPMEEMFLYAVEFLAVEWVFWNNASAPQSWVADGLPVVNKYPSWTNQRSAVPVSAMKDPTDAFWADTSSLTFSKRSVKDFEETQNTSQNPNVSSYNLTDTTDSSETAHYLRGVWKPGDYQWEVGEEYIAEVIAEAGTLDSLRILVRDASGTYSGKYFDLTGGGSLGDGISNSRCRVQNLEKDGSTGDASVDSDYVRCQIYFTPQPTVSANQDIWFSIFPSDGSSQGDHIYTGSNQNVTHFGLARVLPKVRK